MTLSHHDQVLYEQVGLLADTPLAEEVRKVMYERDEAEARIEAVKAAVTAAVSNLDEWAPEWSTLVPLVRRDLSAALAALSVAPQPEPDEDLTPVGAPDDCDHGGGPATSCSWCAVALSEPAEPAKSLAARLAGFGSSGYVKVGYAELAKCEHGKTEAHTWIAYDGYGDVDLRCRGPESEKA